jgi:hypothetical protein
MLLIIAALTTACGGSGSGVGNEPLREDATVSKPAMSVSDVLALMYDPNYSRPSSFYVDPRAQTAQSFTMHHVLDASGSFERCTDDFQQALAWEDADNASRSVQGRLVSTVETPRYFEVARELSYDASIGNVADITSPGFARVYKCSDTSRDGVDRTVTDGFAGRINARPLTADRIRTFTEYLWQFTFFPASRKKVLDSFGLPDTGALEHTLRVGFTTRAGDCDRVEVVDWRFSVDPATGDVDKRWTVVDSFRAKLEDGSPVLCD